MTITWHGHYTIKIVTQGSTIVLDPYSSTVSSSAFKAKADIVGLSSPDTAEMSDLSGIQGEPRIINTPGEYAFQQATVYARGWHDEKGTEHNIQRWHIEDMTLLHLGARSSALQEDELQEIEQMNIDILTLPVGGGMSYTAEQALKALSVIEPSIVIPINFNVKKSKIKLNDITIFAKEMGINPKESEQKLSITSKKIDRENLATIILES